ncbi:MAG: ParM/StbA family protein [Lachnospiraceae bacterium]|nr:ParM/StbA family protein [Lachnospiraceae bacterium]
MIAERDNKIKIAVDPGFDSVKVVINGYAFKFPKEVIDITSLKENQFIGEKKDSYLKVNYIPGKSHLIGEYAARLLDETGKGREDLERVSISDTFATFESADKEVLIMGAIAKALIEYAKQDKSEMLVFREGEDGFDLKSGAVDIYVCIALPHDAEEHEWEYISRWLKGEHKYSIETNEGKFNFDIRTDKITHASQVLAALYGVISDDEGRMDKSDEMLSESSLPSIVIDGGYLTLGRARFTSVKIVDGGTSDQKYAMRNIYEAVAKTIREEYGREDITSSNIKRIMENTKTLNYSVDGKGATLDVSKLVAEESKKTCEALINELKEMYNNLFDIKTLIITGGTGMVYYKEITKLLKDSCPWIKVILTDYEFKGEKISPDYAIAVGSYKVLSHFVELSKK